MPAPVSPSTSTSAAAAGERVARAPRSPSARSSLAAGSGMRSGNGSWSTGTAGPVAGLPLPLDALVELLGRRRRRGPEFVGQHLAAPLVLRSASLVRPSRVAEPHDLAVGVLAQRVLVGQPARVVSASS